VATKSASRATSPGSDLERENVHAGRSFEMAERVASVLCLERSATMRAVLLAKLAERPNLLDRVTVLDSTALQRREIELFATDGLDVAAIELLTLPGEPNERRWRAELRRALLPTEH